MRKFVVQLIALVFVAGIYSCQKELTDPSLTPPTNNNNTNNPNTSSSYMPLTKNTFWKYKDSASGVITSMTVTDKVKTINGRQYTSIAISGGTGAQGDTAYMAKDGANYYLFSSVNTGTSQGSFLFHYLNDTASIGANWTYLAGSGNGVDAYFTTTIIQKGITITVAGKSYSNVIRTKMEMFYDLFGNMTSAAVYDYYIAKGIGIIKIDSNIGFLGVSMRAAGDLVEYSIK